MPNWGILAQALQSINADVLAVSKSYGAFKRKGRCVFLSKKFDVLINEKWCKGCSLCIGVCPKKVLELNQRVKSAPVRVEDCIGCHQCDNVCPDFAITVKESE